MIRVRKFGTFKCNNIARSSRAVELELEIVRLESESSNALFSNSNFLYMFAKDPKEVT